MNFESITARAIDDVSIALESMLDLFEHDHHEGEIAPFSHVVSSIVGCLGMAYAHHQDGDQEKARDLLIKGAALSLALVIQRDGVALEHDDNEAPGPTGNG